MSKPVAWLAYATDASESSFVTQFHEQAEAAARDWGWSVEPLYAKPASQWIAVKDQLPPVGQEFLALVAENDPTIGTAIMYSEGRLGRSPTSGCLCYWTPECEHATAFKPTYWMLLPEPPSDGT